MDRYKEALERAKKGLPIDEVFPELKESEDERIRRIMIDHFKNQPEQYTFGGLTNAEVVAYLEKQKEQEPIPALDRGDEIILKAICEELKDAPGWVERIEGWYSLAKDAQHPAEWSEEDKDYFDAIIAKLEVTKDDALLTDNQIDFLKSLPERFNLPPKQEWSKDDEQYLLVCKNALSKYQRSDQWDANIISRWLENRLKSLRSQPHWKPSEEQMEALARATNRCVGVDDAKILIKLLEQLEKL